MADYIVEPTGSATTILSPSYSYGSAITSLGSWTYTISPVPTIDFITNIDGTAITISTTERQLNQLFTVDVSCVGDDANSTVCPTYTFYITLIDICHWTVFDDPSFTQQQVTVAQSSTWPVLITSNMSATYGWNFCG